MPLGAHNGSLRAHNGLKFNSNAFTQEIERCRLRVYFSSFVRLRANARAETVIAQT